MTISGTIATRRLILVRDKVAGRLMPVSLATTTHPAMGFKQWSKEDLKLDVSLNIPLSCRVDLLLKPFPYSLSQVLRGPDKERRRRQVRQLSQV